MRAVFLDHNTFAPAIQLTAINEQVTELTCFDHTCPEEIVARCIDAELIITNKVVLTAKVLSSLPKLKLICISATGYNNVDIAAASKLGIGVTNVSGYSTPSVSQYVFAQLLEFFQQTTHHNNNTDQGLWSQSQSFCYHGNGFNELAGKTLGIVGYGNLGKAVANIANAFGMNLIISERPNAKTIREGRLSFDEVVTQADVLTLHCPHTVDTENLINQQVLAKMQNSAVLINTARGALVDENALLNALKRNEIAYAVLDVLSQEPPKNNHPLLQGNCKNIKVTAHIAWASMESQQRLINLIGKNIAAFKNNEPLNRLD